MATADDLAAFIVRQRGPMSAIALHALVYRTYAWHLAWDDDHLFDAHLEAWANGPRGREPCREDRGRFVIDEWPWGDAERLTESEQDAVSAVLDDDHETEGSAAWLSQLTCQERPWPDVGPDVGPGAVPRGQGTRPGTEEAMAGRPRSLLMVD